MINTSMPNISSPPATSKSTRRPQSASKAQTYKPKKLSNQGTPNATSAKKASMVSNVSKTTGTDASSRQLKQYMQEKKQLDKSYEKKRGNTNKSFDLPRQGTVGSHKIDEVAESEVQFSVHVNNENPNSNEEQEEVRKKTSARIANHFTTFKKNSEEAEADRKVSMAVPVPNDDGVGPE